MRINNQDIDIRKYDSLYYKDLISRPCCYECRFSSLNRTGDLSIGDLWGAERIVPDFYQKNGVSVVLVNTKKGESLFKMMDSYIMKVEIKTDVWGLYLLAVEEKLELLEKFDQVYVTHFSVCRMLEEITHFKNENIEVILAYLESAEHVKLQSPNFETQLRIRENVKYYEPCSTVAMAIEAEIPAVVGEPMLIQSLIDGFKNYIVRPDDLEKMMEI